MIGVSFNIQTGGTKDRRKLLGKVPVREQDRRHAAELITEVRKSVTIDWTLRESARAKIKVMVKCILNRYGYPPDLQDEAVKTVLAQAELLCADWALNSSAREK